MAKSYDSIVKYIRQSAGELKVSSARFFKTGEGEYAEHDKFLGVKVPTLRKIATDYTDINDSTISSLLASPFNEIRFFALIILTNKFRNGNPECREDVYNFYVDHLFSVNNWNLVDCSAHLIMGAYLYDKNREILAKLAKSENLWERRISIVATWHFILRDDFKSTLEISKLLLHDNHDLIHKAVGWMLRETGKRNRTVLTSYLKENCHNMHKTTLRYALEKFSDSERRSWLNKAKSKKP